MKNDFMLDKVETLGKGIAKTLLNKKEEREPIVFENLKDKDLIWIILKKLLNEGEYNKGEDLLFKSLRENPSEEIYELGQWFYNFLILKSDEELANNNFSRTEVLQGLDDLQKFKEKYLIVG